MYAKVLNHSNFYAQVRAGSSVAECSPRTGEAPGSNPGRSIMGKAYGCSECESPHEIMGKFACLYYAGRGAQVKHLDFKKEYYPPHAFICGKRVEPIPNEAFVSSSSALVDTSNIVIYGFMKALGYCEDRGLILHELWTPSLLTIQKARELFPEAVGKIEKKMKSALEEKIRKEGGGHGPVNID